MWKNTVAPDRSQITILTRPTQDAIRMPNEEDKTNTTISLSLSLSHLILITDNGSMKYVARQETKENPLLHSHGNN
jgi:hypothetical protein